MPIISEINKLPKANEIDIKLVHKNFSKNNINTTINKIVVISPLTIPVEYLSILLRQ